MLREQEKIILQYYQSKDNRTELINLLKYSSLVELESLKDIFIDDALKYQRNAMIS